MPPSMDLIKKKLIISWKITYMKLELQATKKTLTDIDFETSNLKIVNRILDMPSLYVLFRQISAMNHITRFEDWWTLEFFDMRTFVHDFVTRSRAIEEYNIDRPCSRLVAYGSYPPEAIKVLELLRTTLRLGEKPYKDMKDACNSLLDIIHGSEDLGTTFVVLAPDYRS